MNMLLSNSYALVFINLCYNFAVAIDCNRRFTFNFDKIYKKFVILDIVAVIIVVFIFGIMVSKIRKYI